MGQWPEATSDQEWSYCCPRIVIKLERQVVSHIVTAGLIEYLSESLKPQETEARDGIRDSDDLSEIILIGWRSSLIIFQDTEVPALANTSQDSDSERPTKVACRKEKVNLETITDVLSWYKISALNGYNFSVLNENFSGDEKEFKKVSRTVGKADSH